MICRECNTEYEVLVDVDVKEMVPANDMDMETPYCPFCGEEQEWRDGFDEVDV
jgi:uncharacterized protein with PIN domain